METAVFRCDFCGTKSDEEMIGWRQPRCSIELVLRGRRFVSSGGSTLYGVPFASPPALPTDPLALPEDERWAAVLCDRCMKRIGALFGLTLETPEEIALRLQESMKRAEADVVRRGAAEAASVHGKMVSQFPTPPAPTTVTEADAMGGMVSQYPTRVPGSSSESVPARVQIFSPEDAPSLKPSKKKKKGSRSKSRGHWPEQPE